MTYEQFKPAVISRIKELLPPEISVQIQEIRKNNGLKLDGLTISARGSNISPTIFLNHYYENRSYFHDLDAVCQDILSTYKQNKSSENIDTAFFTDYNLVKNFFAYRIINFEKNKELLETVPHVRYLDLAVVFCCHLKISDQNSASILIHSSHLNLWHISSIELYERACQQTPVLLPYDFRNMSAVLCELSDHYHPPAPSGQSGASFCPMYVLTNSHRLYGAGCMLYPGLLDSISEKLHADLMILPSSIHEIIILPASDSRQAQEFADMVAQINQTELAADEILSSHVYYYSRIRKALHICA